MSFSEEEGIISRYSTTPVISGLTDSQKSDAYACGVVDDRKQPTPPSEVRGKASSGCTTKPSPIKPKPVFSKVSPAHANVSPSSAALTPTEYYKSINNFSRDSSPLNMPPSCGINYVLNTSEENIQSAQVLISKPLGPAVKSLPNPFLLASSPTVKPTSLNGKPPQEIFSSNSTIIPNCKHPKSKGARSMLKTSFVAYESLGELPSNDIDIDENLKFANEEAKFVDRHEEANDVFSTKVTAIVPSTRESIFPPECSKSEGPVVQRRYLNSVPDDSRESMHGEDKDDSNSRIGVQVRLMCFFLINDASFGHVGFEVIISVPQKKKKNRKLPHGNFHFIRKNSQPFRFIFCGSL